MKWIVVIVFGVLSAAFAEAAPWVREPGETYARLTFNHTWAEHAPDWRADLYTEYGLSKTRTLTFKHEASASYKTPSERGEAWQIGLRQQLYRGYGLTASFETTAFQRRPLTRSPEDCLGTGLEVRSGLAWSGQIVRHPLYVYGETAWRTLADCDLRRADFGLGTQLYSALWGHIEVWQARQRTYWRSDKLQAELIWRSEALAYSVGYRTELNAAYEETGLILAISRIW